MRQVKASLSPILAPEDVVDIRQNINCVEVSLEEARVELFKVYLERRFHLLRIYTAGRDTETLIGGNVSNCHLSLIREKSGQAMDTNMKIGKDTRIRKSQQSGTSTSNQALILQEGKWGSITYEGTGYRIKCRKTGGGYFVSLSTFGKEGTQVATDLIISPGSKKEIGSTLDELNQKNNSIGIPSGIDRRRQKGSSREILFLQVR